MKKDTQLNDVLKAVLAAYENHLIHIESANFSLSQLRSYIFENKLQYGICWFSSVVLEFELYDLEIVSLKKEEYSNYWCTPTQDCTSSEEMIETFKIRIRILNEIIT